MLRIPITFENFDGQTVTEDHFFNITKSDFTELELRHHHEGGWTKKLEAVTNSNNGRLIMDTFKDILEMSYGIRSADGKRFIRGPEIFKEFTQTPAYDVLFMRIVTEPDFAATFIRGIVPQSLQNEAAQSTPAPQTPAAPSAPTPDRTFEEEAALRARIEMELRAKIAQEQASEGSRARDGFTD